MKLGFGRVMATVVGLGVVCGWGQVSRAAGVPVTNGLALWLDASTITTNDGVALAQWDDLSGNGRHATQATTNNRPVFATNAVNGLPAIRFDGTDDVFTYNGTFLTNTDYTVFCVEARNDDQVNFLFGGSDGVALNNLHLGYRGNTQFTHDHWTGGYNVTIPGFTNKQFKVHSWHLDQMGGNRAMYTDGALLAQNGNAAPLQGYPGAMIGGRRAANDSRFNGDFAEIIMYDRYLNVGERNAVGYYLADKYGSTTAYTDPGSADIAVSVASLSGAVVSIGDEIEYTVTAVNNGYTNATIVVSNAIPDVLNFVSATGGAYSDATGEWTVGDLPYPGSTTLTVRATVKTAAAGAAIPVAAAITSSTVADVNATNNMSSTTFYVREEVDPADFPTKMRIDFTGYTRPETLTNFPALIVLNESIPGFLYDLFASAEGHDLRFVATNGTTVLNHDKDAWNTDGDSPIWVQIDELAVGSHIWAYWGNPALVAPPATSTSGLTWAEDFAGVWHLGEAAAGDDALDAASGANHGAQTGMPETVDGIVAGGRSMADDGRFTVGDGVDLSGGPFTVSVWANRAAGSTGDDMWVGGGVSQLDSGLHLGFRNASLWFGLFSDDGTCTNNYYTDRGSWHYYSMVLDENHGKQIYRDGVAVPTSGASNGFYQSSGLVIGGTYAGSVYSGELDEVRASATVRPGAWVWAEYMTVASNDAFTTYNEVFGLPAIANLPVSGVRDVSAFANADLTFTGAVPTSVTLLWGETDGGAAWGGWANTNGLGLMPVGALSTELTNLTAFTGYAYTHYATNMYGEMWATPSTLFTSRTTPYWIITPSSGPNGLISPDMAETVDNNGSSAVYTFEGDSGYHLTNILIDASAVGASNSYQFVNVTADHSIQALFGINHYTVSVAQAANGSISPTSDVVVAHGDSASYVFDPAAGYYLEDVLVDGGSVGPLEAYTITGISTSLTVTAVFSALPMDMTSDNLVLWLDGSTLSQADGEAVMEWQDYSGRGNHAVQTNAAAAPLFYNNLLGPHVYLGNKYMEVMNESDFDFTTNATIILVGRHTTGGAWTPYISKNGETAHGGWQFREAGNRNRLSFTTRGLTGGDEDLPESKGDIQLESIQVGRFDGSTLTKQVWYNGALDGTLAYTGGAISTNDLAVILGARDGGAGIVGYSNCDIYELLIYDAALTDAELNAVGYYLARKYGIAGDYTHPREPTVAAGGSSARMAASVQLGGTLVSTGSAPTSVWAYWDAVDGGTNSAGWSTSAALGSQPQGPISVTATGLAGDTDYVCRFFASNVFGTAWSDAQDFESGVDPANYTNSLRIQFSGYAGTEVLTNFPALVALSEDVTNFNYASLASVAGADLRFTDNAMSKTLNYEIENWVPNLMNQDIGTVAAAGSLSVSGGTYTVSGSGADIWGNSDEFHFAYTTLRGDGAVTARVRDIANPGGNAWCKSGVMIRETLAANSAFASVIVRTDGQSYFMYRASAGAAAAQAAGLAAGPIPGWVRLVRSGSNFVGYASTDGETWVTRSTQSVAMATNVLIGLAVTSHTDGSLSTVNFDNVNLVPDVSHVWVQVPEIASSDDYIWAFWGNPSRTMPPVYTTDGSTWSAGFEGVWHMSEETETDVATDATALGNDGVPTGRPLVAGGLIHGGRATTGTHDFVVSPELDLSDKAFTLSAWLNRGDDDADDHMVFGGGANSPSHALHCGFRDKRLWFGLYGDDGRCETDYSGDKGYWHYYTWVLDGAHQKQIYRDGVAVPTIGNMNDFYKSAGLEIAAQHGGAPSYVGVLDEVRASPGVARSADWIQATYSNQVAGSSFLTYSDEPPVAPSRGLLLIVR
jgi:uncharacterized repeat protein (TIGR01451 family)